MDISRSDNNNMKVDVDEVLISSGIPEVEGSILNGSVGPFPASAGPSHPTLILLVPTNLSVLQGDDGFLYLLTSMGERPIKIEKIVQLEEVLPREDVQADRNNEMDDKQSEEEAPGSRVELPALEPPSPPPPPVDSKMEELSSTKRKKLNSSTTAITNSFDETIESVVRWAVESTTDEEMEALEKEKEQNQKKGVSKDAVPFQYSGQTFNEQSQKQILNVFNFLRTHDSVTSFQILKCAKTPQQRATTVLNRTPRVIGKIRKDYKKQFVVEPKPVQKSTKPVVDKIGAKEEQQLRGIICELQENRIKPTVRRIMEVAREKMKMTASQTSFRKILHRMGHFEKKSKVKSGGNLQL